MFKNLSTNVHYCKNVLNADVDDNRWDLRDCGDKRDRWVGGVGHLTVFDLAFITELSANGFNSAIVGSLNNVGCSVWKICKRCIQKLGSTSGDKWLQKGCWVLIWS